MADAKKGLFRAPRERRAALWRHLVHGCSDELLSCDHHLKHESVRASSVKSVLLTAASGRQWEGPTVDSFGKTQRVVQIAAGATHDKDSERFNHRTTAYDRSRRPLHERLGSDFNLAEGAACEADFCRRRASVPPPNTRPTRSRQQKCKFRAERRTNIPPSPSPPPPVSPFHPGR